ncbi:MAG TPA: NAD-dependent epimerase/dehydratase family protein [Actinomycetota bacterium]|nr:NAD-dependent epimerase/dehydratase family protein [Actinomycetota bacterium]
MPVVVTGANGLVGRALVPRLAGRSVQVRAVVRDRTAAEPIRRLGAKVAVARLEDTETLSTVMAGAHTVCHLAGGLDLPDDAAYLDSNLGTTRSVLEAAEDAGIARVLFLSYPGASPDAANAYLRAKGMAEEAVRSAPFQHAILRCTHVYGPGSRWLAGMGEAARGRVAVVVGPGTQRVAPVFVADVVAALEAADDRASEVAGTFGLQGPDEVTADELTDLLAGRRRRKLHLPVAVARRAARIRAGHMSHTLLEILAADSLADAPDAAAEFGLRRTSLADGLAAS